MPYPRLTLGLILASALSVQAQTIKDDFETPESLQNWRHYPAKQFTHQLSSKEALSGKQSLRLSPQKGTKSRHVGPLNQTC